MNKVLRSENRTLLSLSQKELVGLSNALNEVCNGVHIPESEFETRLGVERVFLLRLFADLRSDAPLTLLDRSDVWAEAGSVHVVCVTAFGDPVEMSTREARTFVDRVREAIAKAE